MRDSIRCISTELFRNTAELYLGFLCRRGPWGRRGRAEGRRVCNNRAKGGGFVGDMQIMKYPIEAFFFSSSILKLIIAHRPSQIPADLRWAICELSIFGPLKGSSKNLPLPQNFHILYRLQMTCSLPRALEAI